GYMIPDSFGRTGLPFGELQRTDKFFPLYPNEWITDAGSKQVLKPDVPGRSVADWLFSGFWYEVLEQNTNVTFEDLDMRFGERKEKPNNRKYLRTKIVFSDGTTLNSTTPIGWTLIDPNTGGPDFVSNVLDY